MGRAWRQMCVKGLFVELGNNMANLSTDGNNARKSNKILFFEGGRVIKIVE